MIPALVSTINEKFTGSKLKLKLKLNLLMIISVIIAVILAGCLNTPQDDSPKKIVWYAAMLNDEWELYKPIVDEFTKETGIAVEVKLYGGKWNELSEKLKNEVESGEAIADVVTIDDFAVASTKDYVYDVTDEITKWNEWNSLYEAKKRSGEFDNKIYFMPWRADCLTMYVNTGKLAEYNLNSPGTIDELIAAARIIHEKEGEGRVGMKAKKYEGLTCEIAIFINAYGGNYETFNSEANIKAFNSLQELSNHLHPKSNEWDEGNIPAAMADEEIYINFNWPYQVSILEQNGMANNIKAVPTPKGSVGRGTTMGGGFLAVSKASQDKESAIEFIKFIASKKGQGMQLQQTGWLPIRDDSWDYLREVDPAKYTNLMAYRETLKYGLIRPAISEYPELTKLWQDAFWEIVWEGKGVEDTLNKYQGVWGSKNKGE